VKTNVLVAVDLSENSLRAVDYVAEMIQCHPAVRVTLLSVIKEPSADIVPDPEDRKAQIEARRSELLTLMEQAARRLTSQGIHEGHICLKVQTCSKPVAISDLILYEQKEGDYGTIVIGRRGLSKREEFLFGSISSSVVRDARGCTVWVVE
jgi:nucleotide-binding universal stress UspA family protein